MDVSEDEALDLLKRNDASMADNEASISDDVNGDDSSVDCTLRKKLGPAPDRRHV